MSVYVDPYMLWPKSKRWPYPGVCHLIGDTAKELHAFAEKLGLKRSWFQDKACSKIAHYDITENKRRQAVKLGAIELTPRDFCSKMRKVYKRNDTN